jgi:hypothetical protein
MESETNAALATTTTPDFEHLNLDDIDTKYTELTTLRISPPARQHPRTSTKNNTHTTKRATRHQMHTLLNDLTVAARNQQATKRDLEPFNLSTRRQRPRFR